MPIKFRKRRNLERGTEIEYTTIPIKDIESEDIYHILSEAISKLYESQEVNQDRSSVHSGGRTFSPPSHSEYSMHYWAGENRSDKKVFEETVEDIRKFIKSKEREMIFPLRGKKRKDIKGSPNDYYFLSLKKFRDNLLIRPQPFVHTLWRTTGENLKKDGDNILSSKYFGTLKSVLENGFVASRRDIDGNAITKKDKKHYHNDFYSLASRMKNEPSIVRGDAYSIELFPDEGHSSGGHSGDYTIERASPKRISSVNIQLDQTASPEEKEKKMTFYQHEVNEKYHVPVRFYVSTEDEKNSYKRIFPKRQSLEHKASATTAIIALIASIFLLSTGITGNVINNSSNLTQNNNLGIYFFLIGLIATFFYIYRRR
jgi:hypothetical protein